MTNATVTKSGLNTKTKYKLTENCEGDRQPNNTSQRIEDQRFTGFDGEVVTGTQTTTKLKVIKTKADARITSTQVTQQGTSYKVDGDLYNLIFGLLPKSAAATSNKIEIHQVKVGTSTKQTTKIGVSVSAKANAAVAGLQE